jgi:hypothetical protein
MLDDDNRAVKRRAEIPSRRSAIRELTTGRRSDVISPGRQGGLARVMLAGLRRPPGEDCVAKVGMTANSPCARLVGDFARSEAMHIKCMLWFESWLLSQAVRSPGRFFRDRENCRYFRRWRPGRNSAVPALAPNRPVAGCAGRERPQKLCGRRAHRGAREIRLISTLD